MKRTFFDVCSSIKVSRVLVFCYWVIIMLHFRNSQEEKIKNQWLLHLVCFFSQSIWNNVNNSVSIEYEYCWSYRIRNSLWCWFHTPSSSFDHKMCYLLRYLTKLNVDHFFVVVCHPKIGKKKYLLEKAFLSVEFSSTFYHFCFHSFFFVYNLQSILH